MKLWFLALTALGLSTSAFAGFSVTGITTWGASDATLGIQGFTIEDFEDVNLVSGLQYGVVSGNGNLNPTSTLPSTFKPSDDAFGTAFTQGGGGVWDGQRGVINTRSNQTFAYTEGASWGDPTFYVSAGTSSFGMSIQQMDRDAYLVINGTQIGRISDLTTFSIGGQRQGYLRIDATNGDVINSVGLKDVFAGQGGFNDGYMFDHVAFAAPVPEPATFAVLGLGLLGLQKRRRK